MNPSTAVHPSTDVSFTRLSGLIGATVHGTLEAVTVFDSTGGYKADQWHSDATFRPDVAMGAALFMRQRPAAGGDTLFTNCYAAYDALSGGMKKLLDNWRARHDLTLDGGPLVAASLS